MKETYTKEERGGRWRQFEGESQQQREKEIDTKGPKIPAKYSGRGRKESGTNKETREREGGMADQKIASTKRDWFSSGEGPVIETLVKRCKGTVPKRGPKEELSDQGGGVGLKLWKRTQAACGIKGAKKREKPVTRVERKEWCT